MEFIVFDRTVAGIAVYMNVSAVHEDADLHTFFLDDYLDPWLRLAVPLFFLISAYLLAEKLKETPKEDHWKVTWKYIKRNLYLYLFWMLVLLPIIVYLRLDWWDGNVGMFIWRIVSNSLSLKVFIFFLQICLSK